MITVKKEGVLLSKTKLGFEKAGVLNPAIIIHDNKIHMFYRAVADKNYSSIGYAQFNLKNELLFRSDTPVIIPQNDQEKNGIEDPRIVKIEEVFYLTYTAYNGINALGFLATSKDLITFERVGSIIPLITYDEFNHMAGAKAMLNDKYLRYNGHMGIRNKDNPENTYLWDKNVIFFPRKIDNKFYFIHRIKPDIQIVSVESIEELTPIFWQNYLLNFQDNIFLSPKFEHEVSYVGGGCPPIETDKGWLIIYHGVHDTINGYVYSACAALFELENPQKEIARLPYALFSPSEKWELKGEVNNVCFPSGAAVIEETLYIYYGAADERIALASISLKKLIKEILTYKTSKL